MQNAAIGEQGGDYDKRGHGQHHEGIDKYTRHGDHTLLVRVLNVGKRMRMRSGAHTRLIGKQPALDPLADRRFQRIADRAAEDCRGIECILKNEAEGLRQVFCANDQHGKAAEQIQNRHDGHDFLRDRADALHPADENEGGDGAQQKPDDP